MEKDLFETVFVPIADPEDAEQTARAISYYANPNSEIIVVHVIEKGEGVPDKAAPSQQEEFAEQAYEAFLEVFPDGWGNVRFVSLYGRDVAKTIIEGAAEADATVIAFTPRGGSRWKRLITGDVARKLIDTSGIPVISLPEQPTSLELE